VAELEVEMESVGKAEVDVEPGDELNEEVVKVDVDVEMRWDADEDVVPMGEDDEPGPPLP